MHSSPSFGSDPACSYSNPSVNVRIGRWCAQRLPPAFAFTAREGFTPKHSHARSTPWSVFQDGSLKAITPASGQMRVPQSSPGRHRKAITLPRELRSERQWAPGRTDAGLAGGRVRRRRTPGNQPSPRLASSASPITISHTF